MARRDKVIILRKLRGKVAERIEKDGTNTLEAKRSAGVEPVKPCQGRL
jgi:hypothetical protein